ncbi:uncharacterized protein CLUP02_10696 [Colletotrichum lupini]|uniref:Uncharacterized protein n=1 Tax=Colletotrichum lupini TaxID=145971 RepID=A0A9Q8SX24_9PEZI|nr:uncharacterized protein CLUP02_10696 [Colletotrichum lupini]UQC85199.1 hypothetical protein CLUP02_10696 [Colletotrichum lupini]
MNDIEWNTWKISRTFFAIPAVDCPIVALSTSAKHNSLYLGVLDKRVSGPGLPGIGWYPPRPESLAAIRPRPLSDKSEWVWHPIAKLNEMETLSGNKTCRRPSGLYAVLCSSSTPNFSGSSYYCVRITRHASVLLPSSPALPRRIAQNPRIDRGLMRRSSVTKPGGASPPGLDASLVIQGLAGKDPAIGR